MSEDTTIVITTESQRCLHKSVLGAQDMVTFVDRFRVPNTWHGMLLTDDGTLPLCMHCAVALVEEGAAIEWARAGDIGDRCDCCDCPQFDLDIEEEALKTELIDEGYSEEWAHIYAGDWVYSLLAFATDWDENIAGRAAL